MTAGPPSRPSRPETGSALPVDSAVWRRRQAQLRFQRRLVNLEPQFLPLLLSVLLPVVLLPATTLHMRGFRWLLPVLLSILIVQSLRALPALSDSPLGRLVVTLHRLLGFSAMGTLWLLTVLELNGRVTVLRFAVLVLVGLFSLIASIKLIFLLARVPRVNGRVMAGAGAGYFYLGLTGGLIAAALQVVIPGTFSMGEAGGHELLVDRLTYFSFVVLAGLGLGDVLPHNALGERFVILLSVSGTLYQAVLMGLLIGRYIATESVELEFDALADEAEDPASPLAARLVEPAQDPGPPQG